MSAIVYREFALLCDRPDCKAFYGPFDVERSRAALRKLAAKDGWTHVHERGMSRGSDQDFCPDHKPEED